jgi:cell division protein FtsB
MLVAETPLAERDFRVARDDYERLDRERTRLQAEIADLRREQDRLLDRMTAPGG